MMVRSNLLACGLLALLSTCLAKDFWSLQWSNVDCSGQVVLAFKYLTCYKGLLNYCDGNTPTITTYSAKTCGQQPSSTAQAPPDNCDNGIQVVCSDLAPDALMLYYTDAIDINCTTLAREVWQPKLDTCMAVGSRPDWPFYSLHCNSTGYPWLTRCQDFTCSTNCSTNAEPFQVIPFAAGSCSGGALMNRPNICQSGADEITPTATDSPTSPPVKDNASGATAFMFAPYSWLQGVIVLVLHYLAF
eukprot:TRINITY_DN2131_c0_g1_i1.p1 TRINITY_DN2131_c0_g1~~TRINITY_DN2131_c0_g1_i1.p1  ORF type:complete len:245 (+),score=22.45 TRINITY_DN2131_c0_g1_i1:24-758(+)